MSDYKRKARLIDMIYQILNQVWISLTLLSAIAGILLGIIVLTQTSEDDRIANFKKAIAYAFFSVALEIVSRFIALTITNAEVSVVELIICSIGRLVESIGLWGLVLYLLKIWPFTGK